MRTVTYSDQLTVLECGSCHIPFAIPSSLHRDLVNTGAWFFCPNGHRIHYFETENAALKARLDQAEADAAWQKRQKEQAQALAEAERRTAVAYKGHLTRARKRIANGVCPVPGCKRSGFTKVMAHIATQHADWLAEHPEVTTG